MGISTESTCSSVVGLGGEMSSIESWEKQKDESPLAYAGFCAYRDYGPARNMKKVLRSIEQDEAVVKRRYRTWRNWATRHHWGTRASEYDVYLDKVRLAKRREAEEKLGEALIYTSKNILTKVDNKLDTMGNEELKQEYLSDLYKSVAQAARDVFGIGKEKGEKEQQQNRPFEVKFDSAFEELCKKKEDE
jgi:hypothetical protein